MNVAPVPSEVSSALRGWSMGFRRWLLPLATLCFCWLTTTDAHAYAWMIRHGYAKCSTCHTDPSGGETLTHMGRVQGQKLMTYVWDPKQEKPNSLAKFLNGEDEPNNIRLGGSLRGMSILQLGGEPKPKDNPNVFPMQADIYGAAQFGWFRAGGSVGASRTKPNSAHTKAAQLTKGDEGFQAVSRSHWVGVDLGDYALLRAGRINLPFGIRTPVHTLWTRDATRTDRESDQQHGVSVATWGGRWRSEFMISLGNFQISPDKFRERGYSGFLEYIFDSHLAVGASSMIMQSKAGPYFRPVGKKYVRSAHGLTARYAPSSLSWISVLAEADVLKSTGQKAGYTGFVQVDTEYIQGLHGMLTVETLNAGRPEGGIASPGLGKSLMGYWLTANWFLYDHLNLRVDLVVRDERPTQLYSQLHYYF